jgi:hypothetical protein
MPEPPTIVQLGDVESVPWRGTELVWHPLRAALGTTVAGISAYTATEAGQEVVEDHVEVRDGRAHEEVYGVLEGCARFVIDGESYDAARGTFLKVAPESRRSATALEPGTVVMVIGGPAEFEPAASEWIDRARPHFTADPARARELLDELRATYPDSAAVPLGEALFAAANGNNAAARTWIERGLQITPAMRAAVEHEPSLRQARP